MKTAKKVLGAKYVITNKSKCRPSHSFNKGDVVTLFEDDATNAPYFRLKDGLEQCVDMSDVRLMPTKKARIAELEVEVARLKAAPDPERARNWGGLKVGDKVRLTIKKEAEITIVSLNSWDTVFPCEVSGEGQTWWPHVESFDIERIPD